MGAHRAVIAKILSRSPKICEEASTMRRAVDGATFLPKPPGPRGCGYAKLFVCSSWAFSFLCCAPGSRARRSKRREGAFSPYRLSRRDRPAGYHGQRLAAAAELWATARAARAQSDGRADRLDRDAARRRT